jgi:Cof subfamily protein (haloacid dehalogenase superfamily)
MSIKLIATDMDGTLLNSRKEKPVDFIPWVKQHADKKMVIASGRQYFTLKDDFGEIADDLIFIAENGGLVFEKDQIIYSNPMAYEDISACLDRLDGMPEVTPIICGAESAYMRHAAPYIEAEGHMYYHHLRFVDDLYACAKQDVIVKIALFIDHFKAEEVFHAFVCPSERILPVLSGASWIDIMNRSVNKGAAVNAIQEKYSIQPSECMAFGDYLNDYELLLNCTESYCMENGHPKLKAIAKYTAPSNDEEGVMAILRRL